MVTNESERIVKEELENMGFKVAVFNDGGYPDFIVEHMGKLFGRCNFWVEVKSANGSLSANQIEKISELKEKVYIFVVNNNKITKYRIKLTKTEIIPLNIKTLKP